MVLTDLVEQVQNGRTPLTPAASFSVTDRMVLTGATGIATAGVDYATASGTVTFAPGQTSQVVPITVYGDTKVEPPAIGGEWGLIRFSGVSANANIDPRFFGLGIFVIADDD